MNLEDYGWSVRIAHHKTGKEYFFAKNSFSLKNITNLSELKNSVCFIDIIFNGKVTYVVDWNFESNRCNDFSHSTAIYLGILKHLDEAQMLIRI